jgi:glycosidase
VRHHLVAAAAYWQEFDVDGYRLDVAWALPMELVRHLKEYTRSKNSEFLLLGEVIPREPRYHHSGLDVSYDTDFYGMILDLLRGTRTTDEIPAFWTAVTSRYPSHALGMTYLENPDTPFLRSLFPPEECDAASLILFTWPGIPMLRDPFAAHPDSVIPTPLLSDLLALRTSFPSLRDRSIHWLDTRPGILAYARPGSVPCIVVVNLSNRQQEAELDTASLSNGRNILWKTTLHVGTLPAYTQRGERITLQCPAGSGTVFVPDEKM